MAFLSNMHTHTIFGDGLCTVDEMASAAAQKGFLSLGFSEHGPAEYDKGAAISPADVQEYFRQVQKAKEDYRGKVEIYAGMEVDALKPFSHPALEYIIGSVHYIRDDKGVIQNIQYGDHRYEAAIAAMGGVRPMVQRYYDTVFKMLGSLRPAILGHLDIIVKLNTEGRYFDESSPWYRRMEKQAALFAASSGAIIEVNTGGLARGHRSFPYPSANILYELARLGAPVTITSDAHEAGAIDYGFDIALSALREAGFTSVMRFEGGAFESIPLKRAFGEI